MKVFTAITTGLLAVSAQASSNDMFNAKGSNHAMRHLTSLAEKVMSPAYLDHLQKDKAQLMEYDRSSFGVNQDGHGRKLQVSEDECGLYLAASLAQDIWNCFDLAGELMSMVTEVNCVSVYDFSDRKINAVCNNRCHQTLTEVFETMSMAGCSGEILRKDCEECAENEVCVEDKCKPVCVTDADCACEDVCNYGACTTPSTTEVETTILGINGYKLTLDYICSENENPLAVAAEDETSYCFSDMYNLLNDVNANTFCTDMEAIGCCVGTVFDYMTQCATSNDTITTDVGTISMSDLESFCPEVDFKTSCPSAPVLEENACAEGYFLDSGAALKQFSIFVALIAAMAFFA